MKVINSISEMQALAESVRKAGRRIGFIPTMGFLHEGHLSLIRKARKECDVIVVSVFVNPAQFAPNEDFQRYPRDVEGDRKKCDSAGVDVLFMPSAADMYPKDAVVYVTVDGLSDILEGAVRPGHFRGVATVVAKLFNIVKPHAAFFGQKDFQQCVVIKRMVKGLNMDVDIIVFPTIREQDGLAMSSRNSYLNADEQRAAGSLYSALTAGEALVKSGERDPVKLKDAMRAVLVKEKGMMIDYIEIAEPQSLAPLVKVEARAVMLIAVRLGRTRLIDNILIQ
ncbi:MAG TPA: pantoate--beta-alanine ligase [Nitrospirota bacterium]|nr:pantoate--beta-alanine ligase [Nitrospirota bacterium]